MQKMKISLLAKGGVSIPFYYGDEDVTTPDNLRISSDGVNSIVIEGADQESMCAQNNPGLPGFFKSVELLDGNPVRDLNPSDPQFPVPDLLSHRRISKVPGGQAYIPDSDQYHFLMPGEKLIIDGETQFSQRPPGWKLDIMLEEIQKTLDPRVFTHPKIQQGIKVFGGVQTHMPWDLGRLIESPEQTILGPLQQGPAGAEGWWHDVAPRCGEPYGLPYDNLAFQILNFLMFDRSQANWEFLRTQIVHEAATGYEPDRGTYAGMPRYTKGYAARGDTGYETRPRHSYLFPRGLAWAKVLMTLCDGSNGKAHFAVEQAWDGFVKFIDRTPGDFWANGGNLYGARIGRRYIESCMVVHNMTYPGAPDSEYIQKAKLCASTAYNNQDPETGVLLNASSVALDPNGVTAPWMQAPLDLQVGLLHGKYGGLGEVMPNLLANCVAVDQYGLFEEHSGSGKKNFMCRYHFGDPLTGNVVHHPVHVAEAMAALQILAIRYPGSHYETKYDEVLTNCLDNIGATRAQMANDQDYPVWNISALNGPQGNSWMIKVLPKYLERMFL